MELIKLNRLCKKQSAEISALQSLLETKTEEITNLHSSVDYLNEQKEKMFRQIAEEKDEKVKLNSELTSVKYSIKVLEEQLKDLQNEKDMLKNHNENLLKLSLQQEANPNAEMKTRLINQIKELEENLQEESTAKIILSNKFTNIEALLNKYQQDCIRQSGIILDLQKQNCILEERRKHLMEIEKYERRSSTSRSNVKKCVEHKSTMAALDASKESDGNNIEITHTNDAEILPRKPYSAGCREFQQCKELLNVQYHLNNKYKQQVEELQKRLYYIQQINDHNATIIFEVLQEVKTETNALIQNCKNNILVEVAENLEKVKTRNDSTNVEILIDALRFYMFFSKDVLTKSELMRNISENVTTIGTNTAEVLVLEENTQTDVPYFEMKEDIQTDNALVEAQDDDTAERCLKRRGSYVIEDKSHVLSHKLNLDPIDAEVNISMKTNIVVFELHIEKAVFTEFFDHSRWLIHEQNPRIFLMWYFFDDVLPTCTSPELVSEAVFNATHMYKSHNNITFMKYLSEVGIHIDVHLAQEEVSVKIAEIHLETASVVNKMNENVDFVSAINGLDIAGHLYGWFMCKEIDT